MDRIIDTNVYKNIQAGSLENACLSNENDTNSLAQYINRRNKANYTPMNLILNNKYTQNAETGTLFKPTLADVDRIYAFIAENFHKDKATDYTREEIAYQIGIKSSIITTVESAASKELVAINIAYPATIFSKVAKHLNWMPEGGIPKEVFNSNALYSELRAIVPAYQGNGLGNVLRSKQILDAVERGYSQIVVYTVDDAVRTNLGFGFEELGAVSAIFADGAKSRLHLMKLDINRKSLERSVEILGKYQIR
jgi:hypothetical protein